jgi:hypothetical protein
LSLPAGRLVFGVIIAAMIAALARATVLALARAIEIRRLIRYRSVRPRLIVALGMVSDRGLFLIGSPFDAGLPVRAAAIRPARISVRRGVS